MDTLQDDAWVQEALRREIAKGTLATDEDKDWFAANPSRKHRVRAPLPGEKWEWRGDLTRACATLVKQVEPGFRLRATVTLPRALSEYGNDERTARVLWRKIVGVEP
jgi:hypothetical protein